MYENTDCNQITYTNFFFKNTQQIGLQICCSPSPNIHALVSLVYWLVKYSYISTGDPFSFPKTGSLITLGCWGFKQILHEFKLCVFVHIHPD